MCVGLFGMYQLLAVPSCDSPFVKPSTFHIYESLKHFFFHFFVQ